MQNTRAMQTCYLTQIGVLCPQLALARDSRGFVHLLNYIQGVSRPRSASNCNNDLSRAPTLEALAVHDRGTALVVLLLGDPHLLEGRERGENGTTDPDGVLALGRSNDLDLHGRRSKSSDLLLHTVGETRVHGGTTRLETILLAGLSCIAKPTANGDIP